jgi:hypothetical protein
VSFERIDLSVTLASRREMSISAVSRMGAVHGVRRGVRGASGARLWKFGTDFRTAVTYGHRDPDLGIEIGTTLRDLVFGSIEIRTLFERTRGAAAEQGRALLVRILPSPAEVVELPWELMLDPSGADRQPLTLSADTHIARLARVRTYPTRDQTFEPPLRLLLILSSPPFAAQEGDDLTFDLYEEKQNVLQALTPVVERGLVEVDAEDRPTIEHLRQRIARKRRGYHVVHYVGHAQPQGLMLEGASGREELIEADRFTDLLRQCPDLLMVFFGGCETAKRADVANGHLESLSLSEHCVRDSCQTVVGMQAILPMRTERILSSFFYEGITSGRTVADAVRLARAAVREDEYVGQGKLDWAVPSLFIGGESAGAVIDTHMPATPPAQAYREELNLDKVETDREFIARDVQLRSTIDYLAGRTVERVLWVTGPGDEPAHLVARALDDVADGLDYTLWVTWQRLAAERDPLKALCQWLAELFARRDGRRRTPERGWNGAKWWDRLIEDVVKRRVAIVIVDADKHSPGGKPGIERLVDSMLDRSGGAGLVLLGRQRPQHLPGAEARRHLVKDVSVSELGLRDVKRWVRRHRPALLRFDDLQPAFNILGSDLARWSVLASEVERQPDAKLRAVLAEVAPTTSPPEQPPTTTPVDLGIPVAVAGPFMAGRREEFAGAITELAATYDVAGWMAPIAADASASPIASLIALPSPFAGEVTPKSSDLLSWLEQAIEMGAKLILCDYGSPDSSEIERRVMQQIAEKGILVIAAGGNNPGQPYFPAWHPEVLAVGALADDGTLADYSTYDAKARKPELFAPGRVRETPLARAVSKPQGEGTTFAAMHAMAAALLVWATDRSLDAAAVRATLLDTSVPVSKRGKQRARRLETGAALHRVRTLQLKRALADGPLGLQQLTAASGLQNNVVVDLVEELTADQTLTKIAGREERYAVL